MSLVETSLSLLICPLDVLWAFVYTLHIQDDHDYFIYTPTTISISSCKRGPETWNFWGSLLFIWRHLQHHNKCRKWWPYYTRQKAQWNFHGCTGKKIILYLWSFTLSVCYVINTEDGVWGLGRTEAMWLQLEVRIYTLELSSTVPQFPVIYISICHPWFSINTPNSHKVANIKEQVLKWHWSPDSA